MQALLRPYLPVYDPIRRHRVHRAARILINLKAWPGLEATSHDAAQLALLRLIDLEKQTRRSSRLHQHESAVLLARTSIDTCITGMFCLFVPDAIKRMRADNARSFGNMTAYLVNLGALSEQANADAVSLVGSPHRIEALDKLLEEIQSAGGPSGGKQLYERVYRPVSTLFAHGGGLAILRHVDANDRLLRKPEFPWAKRSPAHVSDACVGLLATLLSEPEQPDRKLFNAFADWHWSHVAPVVVSVGVKGMLRTMHPARIPSSIRALQELAAYVRSGIANQDSIDARRARIRQGLDIVFSAFGGDHSSSLVDAFVEMIMTEDLDTTTPNGPSA